MQFEAFRPSDLTKGKDHFGISFVSGRRPSSGATDDRLQRKGQNSTTINQHPLTEATLESAKLDGHYP